MYKTKYKGFLFLFLVFLSNSMYLLDVSQRWFRTKIQDIFSFTSIASPVKQAVSSHICCWLVAVISYFILGGFFVVVVVLSVCFFSG